MFGDTPLILIEDEATLETVLREMADAPVLGVDTEADSFHHYQEKVCLIQLSDAERDVIVDPLKVRNIDMLGDLFGNPDQVKILHGADYDVVSLKRDYGFVFENIFDTMIASQFLGLERIGLADLIGKFFGYHIDKKYQRHDWAKRPLLEEHLSYARGDTHWLPALRDILHHRLERMDRLDALIEECQLVAKREWTGRRDDPAQFMRIKRAKTLNETGLHVLRALWTYRDQKARELDRPAFKVLPDPILIAVATALPTDSAALQNVIRKGSVMARRHGEAMVAAVKKGLEDDTPLPTNKPQDRKQGNRRGGPGVDRYLGPLKDWRNSVVKRDGLSPVAVANNVVLKDIARVAPRDLDQLSEIPGVRAWQVRTYGTEILEVIEGIPASRGKRNRRRRRPATGEDSTQSDG